MPQWLRRANEPHMGRYRGHQDGNGAAETPPVGARNGFEARAVSLKEAECSDCWARRGTHADSDAGSRCKPRTDRGAWRSSKGDRHFAGNPAPLPLPMAWLVRVRQCLHFQSFGRLEKGSATSLPAGYLCDDLPSGLHEGTKSRRHEAANRFDLLPAPNPTQRVLVSSFLRVFVPAEGQVSRCSLLIATPSGIS